MGNHVRKFLILLIVGLFVLIIRFSVSTNSNFLTSDGLRIPTRANKGSSVYIFLYPAPVSGSIVLAGVLLKLGGYGLFLVIILFTPAMVFNDLVSRLSLLGRGLLAIIVLRTVDIKVAIAYSSVVHMRMVIIILIRVSRMGVAGAM